MKAILALENGDVFEGVAAGAQGETTGEVVFNTSLTGYQEVLTDPSYAGQIVTMTSPLIGNYGVTAQDGESRAPQVAGFVMREASRVASNWRADGTLRDYLVRHGVVAIADIDTRALTRVLRTAGVMRGAIGTGVHVKAEDLVARAQGSTSMVGADLVREVTCAAPFDWVPADEPNAAMGRDLVLEPQKRAGRRLKLAAYDLGMKYNILRRFAEHGIDVRVYPATTPAEELMKDSPDGVFFSNGPGDPSALGYVIDNAIALADADVPVFGICLGHQILAQAMGAKTFKLKFGHRGTNHPVKNLVTGEVEITSQNHGFAVDPASIPDSLEVTHVNLYDGTVEGLRSKARPVFCVQYHPEAAPGPHDADYLFRQFLDAMEART